MSKTRGLHRHKNPKAAAREMAALTTRDGQRTLTHWNVRPQMPGRERP